MIPDDNEQSVTQERIAYFLRLLAQLRVTSRPDELPLVASGYRSEVEKMQRDVLDYLTHPATQTPAKGGWDGKDEHLDPTKALHATGPA